MRPNTLYFDIRNTIGFLHRLAQETVFECKNHASDTADAGYSLQNRRR